MMHVVTTILLTLITVITCAQAYLPLPIAENLCQLYCQCFTPATLTFFYDKAKPVSPQDFNDIAFTMGGRDIVMNHPARWGLIFPYLISPRIVPELVKASLNASVVFRNPYYRYEFFGPAKYAYGGYVSGYTWDYFIVKPLYGNFRLERVVSPSLDLSISCYTARQQGAVDMRVYTFPKKAKSAIYPTVLSAKELSMCVWAAYKDNVPPKCGIGCITDERCRYRTIDTTGAIVWAINRRRYLRQSQWEEMAKKFISTYQLHWLQYMQNKDKTHIFNILDVITKFVDR